MNGNGFSSPATVNFNGAGITAASRIYDATTVAGLTTSSAALVGVVGADAVTLEKTSAAGAFDSKTIGTAKLVQVSGLTLSGADAGNYTVTQPTTTADVTAKALTVSGATVATKIYDNNRTATLSFGSAALVGIISPDSVALLSGAATGDRAKYNRNAEEFCAFGKDDYELFDANVNTAGKLTDKFGNVNIRIVFDTDGNGTIKGISTPLPDDLSATKNPNGIDSTTGIPARVIIFTTIRDVGSTDGQLGPDDVADIIAIQ